MKRKGEKNNATLTRKNRAAIRTGKKGIRKTPWVFLFIGTLHRRRYYVNWVERSHQLNKESERERKVGRDENKNTVSIYTGNLGIRLSNDWIWYSSYSRAKTTISQHKKDVSWMDLGKTKKIATTTKSVETSGEDLHRKIDKPPKLRDRATITLIMLSDFDSFNIIINK